MNYVDKLKKARASEEGFSLVELMVVVAIIGILASLAVPRFRIFQAKARQSEAKSNLSHVYTLEQSYYGDEDTYVVIAAIGRTAAQCPATGSNAIGFKPEPCAEARYEYSVAAGGTGIASSFTGTATTTATAADNKVVPNCATADIWTMTQDKVLTHTSNSITACL